ncbi:HD-GYP domain-containing protein [Endothiovibrio diazotrophicus]
MKQRIAVGDLRVGMFVDGLDRSWLQTPFWSHSFLIRSEGELESLRGLCDHVYIDPRRGSGEAADGRRSNDPRPPSRSRRDVAPARSAERLEPVSMEEELGTARKLHQEAGTVLERVLEDARLGRSIDSKRARSTVRNLVGSVIRNPDALVCLTRIKERDRYTSQHSVNVCIFSLVFGRHLGLSKEELAELGMGALLHDVGKTQIPLEILNKPGRLTEAEFEVMKRHPSLGYEMLQGIEGLGERGRAVAHAHHERHDGSGYPHGLSGRQIGLFPRLVSIVDVYDAVTSPRVYHNPISAHRALQKLYAGREADFDRRLVDKFIQCVGIYPVGSLVELSSGEVGVVTAANQRAPTRPVVSLVINRKGERFERERIVNLLRVRRDHGGRPLGVKRVLDPGEYAVDSTRLCADGAGRPFRDAFHAPAGVVATREQSS